MDADVRLDSPQPSATPTVDSRPYVPRPPQSDTSPSGTSPSGTSPHQRLLRTGFSLLFPPRCPWCLEITDDTSVDPRFCEKCVGSLLSDPQRLCRRCGGAVSASAIDRDACAQCRGQRFMFDVAIPLGLYRSRLRDVVIRMKEPRATALAAAIGNLMSLRASEVLSNDLPERLTFAPMHWRRRISRRVNNAERLAIAFGNALRIPVDRRLVVSTRQTHKQSLLSVNQRRENVRGAFRVVAKHDLDGLHIGLVDDTMTTGATADEISRMLLRAGAARVTLFLAARGVSS